MARRAISRWFTDEHSTDAEDMVVKRPEGKNSSPNELLRWLWKQLNRDLKTFLPTAKQQPSEATPVQLGELHTLRPSSSVDPAKLVNLQSRRAILDWRDGFHVRVTQRAQMLRNTFIDEMNEMLEGLGITERVVPKRASDILQDPFIRTVRVPLFHYLTEEEQRLSAILRELSGSRKHSPIFEKDWSASECARLVDIRFKPANQDKLRVAVDALILGQSGIVRPFLTQADRIAQVLINEELRF